VWQYYFQFMRDLKEKFWKKKIIDLNMQVVPTTSQWRGFRRTGHVEKRERINNTVFWSEKTEGRRQLGRPRRKWEDNIKWIFSRVRV